MSVTKHGISLATDRRMVRLELQRDGQTLWDDLGPEDVDILIDALKEMREQMPDRNRKEMSGNRSYQELSAGEVRMWKHEGDAIALKCVTREGDPVELNEDKAEELASALLKLVAELRSGA